MLRRLFAFNKKGDETYSQFSNRFRKKINQLETNHRQKKKSTAAARNQLVKWGKLIDELAVKVAAERERKGLPKIRLATIRQSTADELVANNPVSTWNSLLTNANRKLQRSPRVNQRNGGSSMNNIRGRFEALKNPSPAPASGGGGSIRVTRNIADQSEIQPATPTNSNTSGGNNSNRSNTSGGNNSNRSNNGSSNNSGGNNNNGQGIRNILNGKYNNSSGNNNNGQGIRNILNGKYNNSSGNNNAKKASSIPNAPPPTGFKKFMNAKKNFIGGAPRKRFENLKGVKNNGKGSTTNPLFKNARGLKRFRGAASKVKSAQALGTPRKRFENLKGVKNNGKGSTTNPLFKNARGIPKAPPPPAIRRPGVPVGKKNSRSLANQLANRRKGLKKPPPRFVPPKQGPMAAPAGQTNAQKLAARFKAQREARGNPNAGPRMGARGGVPKPRPRPSFKGAVRTQQAGARMGARGGVPKPRPRPRRR